MSRRILIATFAACVLVGSLIATSSDASTANAKSILTQTLTDAAPQTSMTVAGTFSGGGVTATVNIGIDASAQGGLTVFAPLGSEDLVAPTVGNYFFVKASSLAILKEILEVKSPTRAEIGVWYKVSSSDPRYAAINGQGGAQNVAQFFSYSKVGWSRSVSYGGTTVLRGVRVVKLIGASNMWVNKGFGRELLYVTDVPHPFPFAVSGPAGTTGLLYFSKWGSTKVVIPSSNESLPH